MDAETLFTGVVRALRSYPKPAAAMNPLVSGYSPATATKIGELTIAALWLASKLSPTDHEYHECVCFRSSDLTRQGWFWAVLPVTMPGGRYPVYRIPTTNVGQPDTLYTLYYESISDSYARIDAAGTMQFVGLPMPCAASLDTLAAARDWLRVVGDTDAVTPVIDTILAAVDKHTRKLPHIRRRLV